MMKKGSANRKIFKVLIFFLFYLSLHLIFTTSAQATCGYTIGNNTVDANCTVTADSTYGCESSSGQTSTNNCVLNLTTGTLTLTSGVSATTRVNAGSITLNGGTISLGSSAVGLFIGGGSNAVWVTDADADAWALNFTYYYATASGRTRYGLLKSTGTADCDDATFSETNTCYAYSQSAYYAYSQSGYYTYSEGYYYTYSQGYYYGYSQGYYYSQSHYGHTACFTEGTQILMADGSYNNIEDIGPGDKVASYNLENGTREVDTVTKLLVHPDTTGGYLVINGNLNVTPNHPMWVINKNSWARADSLKESDKLQGPNGEEIRISSIEKVDGVNTVYNLSLVGNNNYFTEGMLVHNWK